MLLLLLLLIVQGCHAPSASVSPRANSSLSDVEFAKSTFVALAAGDDSVTSDIDWENFNASGRDVSAKYKPFTDEANRAVFRSSFVSSYSTTFKASGAKVESLTNWKLDSQDTGSATISAETQSHAHLKLTLSKRNGTRLLSGIDIGT